MSFYYTDEYNVLMLISLLKKHHIKKIVVSPGATNVTFVGSVQQDDYFEIYSSVDERSAAYIAAGLAAESGEPVVLSCTGATASRNYIPGLTEAYYRKLPVLAVTSSQHTGRIGQYIPQVMDRNVIQNDIAVKSVLLPFLNKDDDNWEYEVMLNDALLALSHKGGGPVHVNLETFYSKNFSVRSLPDIPIINRVSLPGGGIPRIGQCRIGIVVGQHQEWNAKATGLVERFCELYNGVVFVDVVSNYKGKYQLPMAYARAAMKNNLVFDKLIYIGGAVSERCELVTNEVWKVDPEGSLTAAYRNLRYVFEMTEEQFFAMYNDATGEHKASVSNYEELSGICKRMQEALPELPFSTAWIAQRISCKLPRDSRVYLGSADFIDKWSLFGLPQTVIGTANVSDDCYKGILSVLVGASIVSAEKIHYLIIDEDALRIELMSVPANYIGKNVRIVTINNSASDSSKIAALANAQGMDFHSVSDKESFMKVEHLLLNEGSLTKPVLVEVLMSEQSEKAVEDIMKKAFKLK